MTAPRTLDQNLIRAIFREPSSDARAHDAGAAAATTNDTSAPRYSFDPTPASDIDPAANVNASAVLAVDDIAALLRVGRNTVYALVAKNQIPHRRLGKQIRFSRDAVMSWLAASWQVAKEGK
jgi:excisionase family DNA binding protein